MDHMQKDFERWHAQKRGIHRDRPRPFFRERQIWFCFLGENVGYEQDGRGKEFLRPVAVLKKLNHATCLAVPLTTAIKAGHPYQFLFSFDSSKSSAAIFSQIRMFDAKRLKYMMGQMSQSDFLALKQKVRQLFA